MKILGPGSRIFGWRLVQRAANAAVVLVVAQALGPEGQGRFSLTVVVVMVVAALLNGGMGLAAVPPLRQGEFRPRRVLAAQALWLGIVLLVLAGLAAAVRATPLWGELTVRLAWDVPLLAAVVLAVLGLVLYEIHNYDLLAAGLLVRGTAVGAARAALFLLATLSFVLTARLDLATAVWSFTGTHALAGLALVRLAWRDVPRMTQAAVPPPAGPALSTIVGVTLRRGWIGQLSAISYLLILRVDQGFLEVSQGVAAVGVYSIAAWAGEMLWLIPEALNPLLIHSSAGSDAELQDRTAARAVRVALGATLLAAVPVALLADPLLGLLRDGAFADAALPLRVLLPGVVAIAPGAVLAGDFIGRGRPVWNTQASLLTVTVNVLFCLWWIPKLGIVGAAWASTVAYTVGSLHMLWRFRRATQLSWGDVLLPRIADFRR